jgi:molecular chaperone HscB
MSDYFALFGLPVKFSIDTAELRNRYFEESRKFHPDFFANESEETRDEALAKSTLLNNAYRTLNNQNSKTKYILELKGVLNEKEKEILPAAFLMEMMEINEALSETNDKPGEDLLRQIEGIENDLNTEFAANAKKFDDSGDPKALENIRQNYLKRKYLWRIREALD